MKKINKKILKEIAQSLLFEKGIQPNFSVDDNMFPGQNMRRMFDRPGPDIDGDNNYHSVKDEDVIELPVVPSEIMPALHIEKTPSSNIESKEYCPKNADELMRSTQTLIYNNKSDIGDKEIQQVWKILSKIINKAK